MSAYKDLCTEFYNADKQFAPSEELQLYQELFTTDDLLLEPMCGSGKLLIPLLKLGYAVHGFDNSSCMLESCKQRANELNLAPSLHQGDMLWYYPFEMELMLEKYRFTDVRRINRFLTNSDHTTFIATA